MFNLKFFNLLLFILLLNPLALAGMDTIASPKKQTVLVMIIRAELANKPIDYSKIEPFLLRNLLETYQTIIQDQTLQQLLMTDEKLLPFFSDKNEIELHEIVLVQQLQAIVHKIEQALNTHTHITSTSTSTSTSIISSETQQQIHEDARLARELQQQEKQLGRNQPQPNRKNSSTAPQVQARNDARQVHNNHTVTSTSTSTPTSTISSEKQRQINQDARLARELQQQEKQLSHNQPQPNRKNSSAAPQVQARNDVRQVHNNHTVTSTSTSTPTSTISSEKQRQINQDARLARELQQQEKQLSHNQPQPNRKNSSAAPQVQARNDVRQVHNNHKIIHLPVINQTGVSCGYHATFNAKALDTIVAQGNPITGNAIQQEARQYLHFIEKGKQLTTPDIMQFADRIGLQNMYVIAYNRHSIISGGVQFHLNQDYARFLATIHQRDNAIGHLICNTGGHWITFSVIKNMTGIHIFYMDSVNTPIEKNPIACTLAAHIIKNINKHD